MLYPGLLPLLTRSKLLTLLHLSFSVLLTPAASLTNVLLAENIDICGTGLYDGEIKPPPFPQTVFIELMPVATSSVEFSFNNVVYRQFDDVAMDFSLDPAFVDIFLGYYEAKLFKSEQALDVLPIHR